MKVNLSILMNLISENEKAFNSYSRSIKNYINNISIKELNSTLTVIQDNKEEFLFELSELERLSNETFKLKSILYEKNNTFKLSDGRTIQSAIVENTNLRRLRDILDSFLYFRSNTSRVTEVNNSYFEIREINFDREEIMSKIKSIDKIIQETDFEISKLNSQEFDVTL